MQMNLATRHLRITAGLANPKSPLWIPDEKRILAEKLWILVENLGYDERTIAGITSP
jgi:hypothetical protein